MAGKTIEVVPAEAMNGLLPVAEAVPAIGKDTDFVPGTINQQIVRRFQHAMSQLKVVAEPAGVGAKKVNWNEFAKMREDPNFTSRAQYIQDLLYYTNGVPRPKPLRPVAQNEVGMYYSGHYRADDPRRARDHEHHHIVYLADAGPSDYGEGKYHQVGIDLKPAEKKEDD